MPGTWCPKPALERGTDRKPGQACRQGNEREQDRQDGGLIQRAAGAPIQEGGDGGGGDEPAFRIDPLEGGHAEESSWCVRDLIGMSRGRDTPSHPAQHRGPAPPQELQCQRVIKEDVAQSQGDNEQHCAHPGHLPQQTRQTSPEPDSRAGRSQQSIAGTRGSGDDSRERHKRDQPGGVM